MTISDLMTEEEINAILEPETGWRVEVAVSPHDESEFLRLFRKAGATWDTKEFVGAFPRESPVGVIVACGSVAGHYFRRGSEFGKWVSAVEAEARRVLVNQASGPDDFLWLIGGPEHMRPSFEKGDSAAEYVQAQLDEIPMD